MLKILKKKKNIENINNIKTLHLNLIYLWHVCLSSSVDAERGKSGYIWKCESVKKWKILKILKKSGYMWKCESCLKSRLSKVFLGPRQVVDQGKFKSLGVLSRDNFRKKKLKIFSLFSLHVFVELVALVAMSKNEGETSHKLSSQLRCTGWGAKEECSALWRGEWDMLGGCRLAGQVKGHDRQQGSDIPETPGNPEGNH